jgi:hypothetical protein
MAIIMARPVVALGVLVVAGEADHDTGTIRPIIPRWRIARIASINPR